MYQSLPHYFGVPIFYIERNILDINVETTDKHVLINDFLEITSRKPIVIGVSFPKQDITRWIRDKNFMETYSNNKGIILKTEDANYDMDLQNKQIEKLISEGVDALIIAPLDQLSIC